MKVGDLVMISATGRKSIINREIKSEELGIIKSIRTVRDYESVTKLHVVDWMEHSMDGYSYEYYRRELRFAR